MIMWINKKLNMLMVLICFAMVKTVLVALDVMMPFR